MKASWWFAPWVPVKWARCAVVGCYNPRIARLVPKPGKQIHIGHLGRYCGVHRKAYDREAAAQGGAEVLHVEHLFEWRRQ